MFNLRYFLLIISLSFTAPIYAEDVEEIVVTARAKDESIRDIPVAITAYTEEEMENLNINTFLLMIPIFFIKS